MTDSPLVIEIDTKGNCTIRDQGGELVADDLSAEELQALVGALNLVIPALDSIEKTNAAVAEKESS